MKSMTPEQGFRVLELPPSASEAEAWTAFLRLSRRNHPDLHGDHARPERFAEIVQAYQVVLAELRRRATESAGQEPHFAGSGISFDAGTCSAPKPGLHWGQIGEAALRWWARVMLAAGAAFLLYVVIQIMCQCVLLSFPKEDVPRSETLYPEYVDIE